MDEEAIGNTDSSTPGSARAPVCIAAGVRAQPITSKRALQQGKV